MIADKSVLERLARCIRRPGPGAPRGAAGSILTLSASSYAHGMMQVVDEPTVQTGSLPKGRAQFFDEPTKPTGFDPLAAILFKAVVEAAFMVSSAEKELTGDNRRAFEWLVVDACNGEVNADVVADLVDELRREHAKSGFEERLQRLSLIVRERSQKVDLLRIAALVANLFGGVHERQRAMLERIGSTLDLAPNAIADTIAQAERAFREA